MGRSKVVFDGETLIDLTGDDVTAETLAKGVKAHDKAGNPIVGELTFSTIYSGTSNPSSSLGSNGDIYLKV